MLWGISTNIWRKFLWLGKLNQAQALVSRNSIKTTHSVATTCCLPHSVAFVSCLPHSVATTCCLPHSVVIMCCLPHSMATVSCLPHSVVTTCCLPHSVETTHCLPHSMATVSCLPHSVATVPWLSHNVARLCCLSFYPPHLVEDLARDPRSINVCGTGESWKYSLYSVFPPFKNVICAYKIHVIPTPGTRKHMHLRTPKPHFLSHGIRVLRVCFLVCSFYLIWKVWALNR